MRQLLYFFAAVALLGGGPAQGQSTPPEAARVSGAVLRPGDAIRITVWRKEELSGEYTVAGDGTIAHPFYSEVQVGGIPFASASERVRRYVERFESNPRVLVEPLYQVAVTGEVHAPKLYTMRAELTLAQAIGLAGGPTQSADVKRVRLLRGGRVFLMDLSQPGDPLAQTPISSGDQVVISRRRDVLREYIVPASSVFAALVSLLGLVLANR
jgi:polysaccharide export outer membrane protein